MSDFTDLLLTHETTDFDAFASLMAAARLYPGAAPLLGRRVIPPLRRFLALHKDRFPTVRFAQLPESWRPEEVERVVLVDTRIPDRLAAPTPLIEWLQVKDFGDAPEIHVYDHHPATAEDLVGESEVLEPVGAAVTLLVERLREEELPVDPVEATLYLLGIYSDTGSLRFSSTSARDAAAAAWLLDQGARLPMVNRYLSTSLTPDQRGVFARILGRAQTHRIGGVDVGIATLALEQFVDGLAPLTRQVMELEGHDVLFALYRFGDKGLQVIGRARVPFVHVGRVLRRLGGGGHAGAGSVRLKDAQDPEAVARRLLDLLQQDPPRPRIVSEVMSSPVRTVAPSMPLQGLRESLAAWHHSGVPVVADGRVQGIISRRDLEKAERDGRLHLPVSSCMSGNVKTIEPNATLEEALARMTEADIGRLPVLDGHRLVGIITRTDLTRILYGGRTPGETRG